MKQLPRLRKHISYLFSALLLTLLFGVGSVPRANAIVGGSSAADPTGVVQIYLSNRQAICTGSLINPGWVLTSKHCITAVGSTPATTEVFLGSLALDQGEHHSVSDIYLNGASDVALLKLAIRTDRIEMVVPYGVNDPAVGTPVTVSGWGYTQAIAGRPASNLQISYNTVSQTLQNSDSMTLTSTDGSRIQNGDSGAGVILFGLVCGVHSSSSFLTTTAVKSSAIAGWIAQISNVYPGGACNLDTTKKKKGGLAQRIMAMGSAETTGYDGNSSGYRGFLNNFFAKQGLSSTFVGPDQAGTSPTDHLLENKYITDIENNAKCAVYNYAPDIVTLETGEYDTLPSSQAPGAPARLDSLISTIQQVSPQTVILVASIASSGYQPQIEQYNSSVKSLVLARKNAGQHVDFIDNGDLVTTTSLTNIEDGYAHENGPVELVPSGFFKEASNFSLGIDNAVNAGWIPDSLPLYKGPCDGTGGSGGGGTGKRSIVDLRVMPIGDSITEGYRSTTGNGYRYALQQDIQNQGQSITLVGDQTDGTMTNPQNEGFSGREISYIAGQAVPAAASWRPNVALILAGTNDLNLKDNNAGAPARLDSMIGGLFQSASDATLLVAGIPPSSDSTLNSNRLAFNASVQVLVSNRQNGGQHIAYVDMNNIDPNADKADSLHPNDTGYKIMGDNFSAAIENAMNQGWVTAPVASSRSVGGTGGGGYGQSGPLKPAPVAGSWVPKGQIASGVPMGKGDKIIMADMDGDRRPDYVIVGAETGSLTVYLNGGANAAAGGWLWNPKGLIAGGTAPGVTIQLADLNGDGRADYIAVDQATGALSVYLNGGPNPAAAGGWLWYPLGTIAGGVASNPTIEFGDLNGDGMADYLIVDPATGAVQAYLNGGANPSAPNGWVWYPQPPIAAGVGAPVGSQLQFADINGDGYADYLTVSSTDGTVSAYVNHGLLPDKSGWWWIGTGQIAPGIGAPSSDLQVVEADIDGDGRADYLAINRHTGALNAWLNNGNDTSSVAGWLPRGQVLSVTPSTTQTWQMADLDGDGQADFLQIDGSSGTTSLQLNKGAGAGPGGSWGWGASAALASGLGPDSTYVDLNGDGRADYIQVDPGTGAVNAYINGGLKSDGSWIWYPQGIIYKGYKTASAISDVNIQFADFSGDGKAAYLQVHLNGSVDAALNTGQWTWGDLSPVIYLGFDESKNVPSLHFADIDGDRKSDLLIVEPDGSVQAWLNGGPSGSGWYWKDQGQITSGTGATGNSVQFADVDGDGRADYIAYDQAGGHVTVFLNNGTDAHIAADLKPRPTPPLP